MKSLFLAIAAFLLPAMYAHAAAPTISAPSATSSGGSATISGTVTANGAATTVRVEYGETTAYGTSVSAGTFSDSASNAPFTITLPGLKYATAYHFKVVAENGEAPAADSGDLTFTVPPETPGIGTPAVNVIDSTQATITATITAKGADTTVKIDYGTTNALGSSQAATTTVLAGESKAVAITLMGLTKAPYFYKVVATNSVATTTGPLLQFTVPQAPQVTASVTPGANTANIVAKVTAHGDAVKLTLNYGLTTAYGTSKVINGVSEGAVNLDQLFEVTGLVRNTTYNFNVRAEHSGGSAVTTNATFKTLANTSPVAKADTARPDGRNPITIPVLANDSDANGDTLTIQKVTKPIRGTAVISGTTVIYTPGDAFKGRDEFAYTITDGQVPPGIAVGRVTIAAPQIAVEGVNSAIIKDADGNAAGAYKIVGTASGKFTARVNIGTTSSVVTGQLDADGKFTTTLANGMTVNFAIAQTGPVTSITADFERGGKDYSSEALVNAVTSERMSELAGLYTMAIPAPGTAVVAGQTSTGLPEGSGFIRMTVKEWGGVRVQGLLGDGTKFSYASTLSGTDAASVIPLWLSPRDARVSGTIALAGDTDVTAAGTFKWYRPPGKDGNRFEDGFYTEVRATGGAYVAPLKNERLLDATDNKASITIKGGDLGSSIIRNFTIDKSSRPQFERGIVSKLTIYPAKGYFTGVFEHPVDGDNRSFQGVLLSQQNRATGVFSGRTQTGTVEITPGTIAQPTPTPTPQPGPGTGNPGVNLGGDGNLNFGN